MSLGLVTAVRSDRMNGGSMGGGGGGGGAETASAAPEVNALLSGNAPPPFLSKTYEMVEEPATDAIISWGPQGNSLVVWDQAELSRVLLPKYFKHGNFSSFVRQLNTYGFKKVGDRWEFANEGFLKGQKHLLKNINRRRSSHAQNQSQQPQPQNVSVAACVEVGKFGMEEGMEEEIEMLKQDKNVLMQELIRLRQQQQASDNQLQTMVNRLEQMERRQQLMMSFLAKAMQRSGFFAQLVQQNESNRRIVSVNKKRRLPMQESSNMSEDATASSDGQMIKYQPLMDVLQFDLCPQPEPMNTSDGLLADNFSSPCLNANPGVTLEEVPQIAAIPSLVDDLSILSTIPEAIPCEFSAIQGMDNDGDDIPIESFVLPKSKSFVFPESESLYIDQIVGEVESPIPMDEIGDEHKFSDIMDSFLEELASSSPESRETEGIVSSLQEAAEMQLQQPTASSRQENARNLYNLAAQMGLLTSDSKA